MDPTAVLHRISHHIGESSRMYPSSCFEGCGETLFWQNDPVHSMPGDWSSLLEILIGLW